MKLFKWIKGRQSSTEYYKWCFLYFKIFNIGIDGYVIRYEPKTILPIHKDPLPDTVRGSHYRLNIKIKGRSAFWCPSTIWRCKERVVLFRPDLFYHSLTAYTRTYKISIGIAIFKSKT